MPTLEVQLAKAERDLVSLEEVMKIKSGWEVYGAYWRHRLRADQLHGNDAELRGLRQRVRYLQQRLTARIEERDTLAKRAVAIVCTCSTEKNNICTCATEA